MKSELYGTGLQSRAFSEGGMYIMRAGISYVLFIAHKVGVFGTGPHKHNDALSFEWCFGEQPIVVDPGTGCYTGDLDKKNGYRSTRSHNTVVVDGKDQIPISGAMFALKKITGDVDVIEWLDDKLESVVSANHTYYAHLPEPIVHHRSIALDKINHQAIIEDRFSGSGTHKLEWFFHLAPDLNATHIGNQFSISADNKIVATIHYPDSIMAASVISGAVSGSYNEETNSQILYCEFSGKNDIDKPFTFQMRPAL